MSRWKYKNYNADECASVGKIRRGKKHRKKLQNQESLELDESEWRVFGDDFTARVVEVQKRYVFVSPEEKSGEIKTCDVWLATVPRKFLTMTKKERNLVCVGDRVLCRPATDRDQPANTDLPSAVIKHRSVRKAKIARCDPLRPELEHVLASNVDQLVVVVSYLKPTVKFGLIDRYLLLAEEQGLAVTIVFNKQDLLNLGKPGFKNKCNEMLDLYKSLGYEVITVSAHDGFASDECQRLASQLAGKISILSGHSGVGKSSLVNLFDPEIVQEVEENDDIFYKGRHTTTYASFIKLKAIGGYVIDTPGIRSFLLGERGSIALSAGFREFAPELGQCKYRE